MNGNTPGDSEERSDFNPPQSIRELAELQVRAYENRVRERLVAKSIIPGPLRELHPTNHRRLYPKRRAAFVVRIESTSYAFTGSAKTGEVTETISRGAWNADLWRLKFAWSTLSANCFLWRWHFWYSLGMVG